MPSNGDAGRIPRIAGEDDSGGSIGTEAIRDFNDSSLVVFLGSAEETGWGLMIQKGWRDV